MFDIAAGDTAGLVAAVTAANTNGQADTINLAAGSTYLFTSAADVTEGGSALPSVILDGVTGNSLTINGNGAKLERDSDGATPNFRFLRISTFPNIVSVTINDLSFANGNAGAANGGAILLNAGDLFVTNSHFSGNQATVGGAVYATNTTTTPRDASFTNTTFIGNTTSTGAGGGLYQLGSTNVTITNSVFQQNISGAEGGGMRFQSSNAAVTVDGSTFTSNAANGKTSGSGAGLFIQGPATVTNSTIRDNIAAVGGGGLWIQNGGSLTMRGSTVSGNKANGSTSSGGGIFAQGPTTIENSTIHNNRGGNGGGLSFSLGSTVTASVTHSTVTDNSAFFGLATGGGIRITGTGTFNLGHTIVAGNVFEGTVSSGTGPDIGGVVNSLGYNLIGTTTGATINGNSASNLTGVAADLGSLQDNGGPTWTRIPNASSPVVNAGDPSFVAPPTTDQRGTGFNRVAGGRVDIGAVEAPPLVLVSGVQINDGSVQRSIVSAITITFDQALTLPANPANAFQLKRTSDGATVELSATPSGAAVTLTFTGGAVNGLSLADGRYTLTVLAAQIPTLDGNGDGTAGDDFVLVGDPAIAPKLYRLFGDADGDNDVDTSDFGAFRSVFGGSSSIFDFDGDGDVDTSDFGAFRGRFGAGV